MKTVTLSGGNFGGLEVEIANDQTQVIVEDHVYRVDRNKDGEITVVVHAGYVQS